MLGCRQRHGSYVMKMLNFLKNRSESIVMMTKEGSTKILNFMTPGAAVLVVRRGPMSNTVKKD